ncbi:MAG TPA: hypothetical protein VLI72_02805 [Methylibium sp.]|nr:hypothetical protein [Methylibium sp.]
MEISITALPARVTLARPDAVPPLVTRAAYEVTLKNLSTNTLNKVSFKAATTVDGAIGQVAPYFEDNSTACQLDTTVSGNRGVVCNFGQVRGSADASGSGRSVIVVFNAPSEGSRILLNWTASYSEGGNDSTGASHTDTQAGVAETLLGTPTDTEAKSYIKASGDSLFTGLTGAATPTDQWTTTVKVPKAAKAAIFESQDLSICSSSVIPTCVSTALSIPGTYTGTTSASFLIITLRRDAQTIPTGAKIRDAELFYQPGSLNEDTGVFTPSAAPSFKVKNCSELAGGVPGRFNTDGSDAAEEDRRCIKTRTEYSKSNQTPFDFRGDWEFILWAVENGRISF